jgi:hypothetical protein
MRYSLRTLAEVVTVAAFILALTISWRAWPASPPPVGRYQLFMSETQEMVFDTATGELWSRPRGHSHFQAETPWSDKKLALPNP